MEGYQNIYEFNNDDYEDEYYYDDYDDYDVYENGGWN